jgi:hypothetical protein
VVDEVAEDGDDLGCEDVLPLFEIELVPGLISFWGIAYEEDSQVVKS